MVVNYNRTSDKLVLSESGLDSRWAERASGGALKHILSAVRTIASSS